MKRMGSLLLLYLVLIFPAAAEPGKDKKEADNFFYKAMGKRIVRKYSESLELLRKAIDLNPGYGLYWHWQGKIELYILKVYKEAIISLSNAHRLMPDNPWTRLYLGEAYRRGGQEAQAAETWRQAISWYRGRNMLPEYELYEKMGRVLRDGLKQPDAALAVFREGAADYPDKVQLMLEIAGLTAQLGQVEEARRILRQAADFAARHFFKIPAWVDRDIAVIHRWRLKDPQASLTYLGGARRRHPREPFLLMQSAYAWTDLGQYNRAADFALRALSLYETMTNRNFLVHYHYLATLAQERLQKHDLALVWLRAAAARYPGDPETLRMMALSLQKTGKPEEQVQQLREYLRIVGSRDHIPAMPIYTDLAEALLRQLKRPSEALVVLDEAIRVYVREPSFRILKGQAQEDLAQAGAALASYREAETLLRQNKEAVPAWLTERIKKIGKIVNP